MGGRPPVPQGLYNESRLDFLCSITQKIIPPELILNADQTPSSYVLVGRQTMAARGSKSVPIKGLSDKRKPLQLPCQKSSCLCK